MLLIKCPLCGAEGDETEFQNTGEAHIRRPATRDPANITDTAQRDYLFMRSNPRGPRLEQWQHQAGCGKWFHMARDTLTMEILGYYGVNDPPSKSSWRPLMWTAWKGDAS